MRAPRFAKSVGAKLNSTVFHPKVTTPLGLVLFAFGTFLLIGASVLVLQGFLPPTYSAQDMSFVVGSSCDGKVSGEVISGRTTLKGLDPKTKLCVQAVMEARIFGIATDYYEFYAGTLLLFIYTLHFLIGYLNHEDGPVKLMLQTLFVACVLVETFGLVQSIMRVRDFTGGLTTWKWEATYGSDWQDQLLTNNNPFAGEMNRVFVLSRLFRAGIVAIFLIIFALDICTEGTKYDVCLGGHWAHTRFGIVIQDIYVLLFTAGLVIIGLIVFWFYLVSMGEPTSVSWSMGCSSEGYASQYDLLMDKCYGVADPIKSPNKALFKHLAVDVGQGCPAGVNSAHVYNTKKYQDILSGPDDKMPELVKSAADISGKFCIVDRCITESVAAAVDGGKGSYFTFYVGVLIFYLLTLSESVEFIKQTSISWYPKVRLLIGVCICVEVGAFVIGFTRSVSVTDNCPLNLDYNNPPAGTYNFMTMGSSAVRFVTVAAFSLLYLMARCKGDVPGDGPDGLQAASDMKAYYCCSLKPVGGWDEEHPKPPFFPWQKKNRGHSKPGTIKV